MDMNWMPGMTLASVERAIIEKAFRFYDGNKTRTAQSLGIAIRTLDNRLEEYAAENQKLADGVVSTFNAPAGSTEDSPYNPESASKVASEQSLSVQKRQEVQKVSPQPAAKVHSGRGR